MATAVKMESSSRQDDLVSRCINALPEVKKVVAGGIAGCVSKTFVAPLSRVSLLMQVQSMRPHKFADGRNPNNQYLVASLRKIYLEEGLTGFWRGNLATCFHRFPYTSITFYANAAIRETLQQNASTLPDQSRHLLAGGGAACAAVCTLHPLDVIKTRLMAQTRREYYTGVLDCVQKICRDEGLRGLYFGISVSLCSTTPSIAISFTAFDEFKRLFATTVLGPDEPDNFRLTLCSGACAGSLASTVMFPMDLVRRQMQMVGVGGRPLVYANVGQAIYHVFQTGFRRNRGTALGYLLGLREFFRGLAPELLKVAPHNAIMFSTQHHLISRKWLFEELLYPD